MPLNQTKIIQPQLPQQAPELKSQKTKNTDIRTELKALIKFKESRNACYFVVNKKISCSDDLGFDVYSGAMLLFTDIMIHDAPNFYNFIVMYRNIHKHDEGIIAINVDNIIDYLIDGTITAHKSSNNKLDEEFTNLILEKKGKTNGK